MLPVLVAAAGVIGLGVVETGSALAIVTDAARAGALARASIPIAVLSHEVTAEYVQTDETLRAGAEFSRMDAQMARTDAADRQFRVAVAAIRTAAPALTPLCDAAERAVSNLGYARISAQHSVDGAAETSAYYDETERTLSSLASAIPAQLSDTHLIDLARSVAVVSGLDHVAGLQLDVLTRALSNKVITSADARKLPTLAGEERGLVNALRDLAPAADLYASAMSLATVATAASIRQVVLDALGGDNPQAGLTADVQVWHDAQSARIDALAGLRTTLAATLVADADALGRAARNRMLALAGLSGLVVAATLVPSTVLAVRISRRLRRTRHAALTAARLELPTAISNVIAARNETGVRSALADSAVRIDAMLTPGPDEIGELAAAFGAVHRQALRLAADQALLRMEVQAMFIALSRRGQTLVQRQIHLIDEFGRHEADPQALSRLFALDHLAARMRRNEENLLVLAGGEPGRWITRPIALFDLLRAAAQEIEEYQRVEIRAVPEIAVAAAVAGDAIHLVAELLENATSFSPPTSTVRISADGGPDGTTVTVTDDGIGLPPEKLAEANERLAHPSALTSALVGTMGLLVVARLAERHKLAVRLTSVPAGGTTAEVVLPDRLLLPVDGDTLQPARWIQDAALARLPLALEANPASGSAPATDPAPAAARPPIPRRGPGRRPLPVALPRPRDEVTSAGLPRRPGREQSEPQPPAPTGLTPPDPEAVRARLSSLATGMAAAREQHADPARSD